MRFTAIFVSSLYFTTHSSERELIASGKAIAVVFVLGFIPLCFIPINPRPTAIGTAISSCRLLTPPRLEQLLVLVRLLTPPRLELLFVLVAHSHIEKGSCNDSRSLQLPLFIDYYRMIAIKPPDPSLIILPSVS